MNNVLNENKKVQMDNFMWNILSYRLCVIKLQMQNICAHDTILKQCIIILKH